MSLAGFSAIAQDLPNSFNYEATIFHEDGSPVPNKDIKVEISILQGSDCANSKCPIVWQELHNITTNDFGQFTAEIGSSSNNVINTKVGSVDNYSDINWLDVSDGEYYLRVRADFGESKHKNQMSDLGTSKFSAVPYALVANACAKSDELIVDKNGKIKNKLVELADVTIENPTDKQILQYDGTNKVWKNASMAEASLPSMKLEDLTNVQTVGSAAVKEYLRFNGTNWVNSTISFSDIVDNYTLGELADVTITSASKVENNVLTLVKNSSGNLVWQAKAPTSSSSSEYWTNSTTGEGGIYYMSKSGIFIAKKYILSIGNGEPDKAGSSGTSSYCLVGGVGSAVANAKNSLAFGTGCTANGNNSIALGNGATANADQFVFYSGLSSSTAKMFEVFNKNTAAAFVVKADGTSSSSSDERLKTNIENISGALESVMKLRGVSFNWKALSNDRKNFGVIAQEIEKVFPNLVSKDDRGYLMVNYEGLIPVLTEAIKEQQTEIDNLKKKYEELEAKVNQLLNK